jgi:hypothetical protein
MAFMEFAMHVLSQQERGDLIPDDESWSHSRGSFLTTQLMPILVLSLPTRRLLLSSSGPDILPTHYRSFTMSEALWTSL